MKKYLIALIALAVVFGSACSNSSGGGGSDHSSSDVAPAITALNSATGTAYGSGSGSAYATIDSSTATSASGTLWFVNYTDGSSGITLDGSLTFSIDTSTLIMSLSGTINFSGDTVVSKLVYSNIIFDLNSYSISGSCIIYFTDGSSATYDLATGALS
jgi:hypothetical protein